MAEDSPQQVKAPVDPPKVSNSKPENNKQPAGGDSPVEKQQSSGGAEPSKRGDAGSGITGTAKKPRQAAEINSLLREARQTIGGYVGSAFNDEVSVDGDVVGRDKIELIFQGGMNTTNAVRYSIATERISLVQGAFVDEPGYGPVWKDCAARNLVLLRGPHGHGRNAAALRVMIDRQHEKFFGFAQRVPFEMIKPAIEPGAGHLVENAPDDHVRQLSALMLSDLDRELAAAGATLVITISESVAFIDPDVATFAVSLGTPAAHRTILEKHLRFRMGAAAAEALLARTDFIKLFDEQVKPDTQRGRAAEFAYHAARLGSRGELDIEMLRLRISGSITAEVEGWFTGIVGQSLKCLAIAVALLDGLPYQTVESAAESLLRRIEPPPSPNHINPPPPPDKFGDSRMARLSKIRARTVRSQISTRVGDISAEIIQFIDPGHPREVLDLVWREFPAIREDLLNWLSDLAEHPDQAVRVRAATAVGTISIVAFDHIYNTVLDRWAMSDNPEKREVAAYALSEPGQLPAMANQIRLIVDEWARDEEWHRRATAARVFGAALGTGDVDRAFAKMDAIASTATVENDSGPDEPDSDIALAIGASLSELVDADPSLAYRVVERSLQWMQDGKPHRRVVGEIAFLYLAADLVNEYDKTGTEWPTLLSLAASSQPLRNAVATGWHRTLNSRHFHDLARIVANTWAERVEPNPVARDAYARLLAIAAVGSDRTTAILLRLARGWRTKNNLTYAPKTATAVEDALS